MTNIGYENALIIVTPGHRGDRLKINLDWKKKQISDIFFF
jgi:hypothetical protein